MQHRKLEAFCSQPDQGMRSGVRALSQVEGPAPATASSAALHTLQRAVTASVHQAYVTERTTASMDSTSHSVAVTQKSSNTRSAPIRCPQLLSACEHRCRACDSQYISSDGMMPKSKSSRSQQMLRLCRPLMQLEICTCQQKLGRQ